MKVGRWNEEQIDGKRSGLGQEWKEERIDRAALNKNRESTVIIMLSTDWILLKMKANV